LKKKLLPAAMAVALAGGFSGNANAVHIAEDHVGQVLLAPYYNVTNGNKTQVAIVNTRDDVAVKVKVVLRSRAQSTEVLDFICYMSPADVCRFDIVNTNGQAYMYSDDDSIRSSFNPVTFASQTPISQQLFDDRMLGVDPNDDNESGHIEIIGVYGVTAGTVNTPSGAVNVARGMSKHNLVKIFDAVPWAVNATPVTSVIASNDPTLIQLTGDVQVVKTDGSDRMGYVIPALAGAVGDNAAGVMPSGLPFDGRVIANATFDVTLATETSIGNGFGIGGFDNIVELETALAAGSLMGTYEKDGNNRTNLVVTFPTRYRHRINHVCSGLAPTADEVAKALYTAPFASDGKVPYSLKAYDNQEHSVETGDIFSGGSIVQRNLYAEVNYVMPEWPSEYASGWYSMALNATNHTHAAGLVDTCTYGGLPVLGLSHKYFESNGVTSNSMLLEAAR
jgi:hypothetical protein